MIDPDEYVKKTYEPPEELVIFFIFNSYINYLNLKNLILLFFFN